MLVDGIDPAAEKQTAGKTFETVAREQKIERRGALDIAKRVLQTCGQIMRYAVANDFTAHNPLRRSEPGRHTEAAQTAEFTTRRWEGLPELLCAIDSYTASPAEATFASPRRLRGGDGSPSRNACAALNDRASS